MTGGKLRIEVVYATPQQQQLLSLNVAPGTTVAEAIALSAIARHFPEDDLASLRCGIWGRDLPGETVLRDGDRVEIYRALHMDPREARRLRAAAEQDRH